jgi:hypothetical protein
VRAAQQVAIEEGRVFLHRGDHDPQHVVVRAAQPHALDDLRALHHQVFELLQGALRLQGDEGMGDHAEPERAVIEDGHGALDEARLLESPDTPQAGCGGEVHPRREFLVGDRRVALQLIEDADVDGVE